MQTSNSLKPAQARSDGGVDEMRTRLHGMWAGVAPAWGQHADYVDARAAVVTERMLALADPQPGERVLELACGPGGLGHPAANRVGPDGEVVRSDVVAEMTEIAAARAEVLALGTVSARVLDLERIDEPNASYDLVLWREGLMFALDPAGAAGEIRRVLRPGGRFVIAVWGPRARNPWLGIVLDAAAEQFGVPVPLTRNPGAVLARRPTPARCPAVRRRADRTGHQSKEGAEALRARAHSGADAYRIPSGLEFPAVTLIAFGRRRTHDERAG